MNTKASTLSAEQNMEALAAEVAGMTGIDGRPNRWHGYDFRSDAGRIIRLTGEDPEAGIEVRFLDERSWLVGEARFTGGPEMARLIVAYIRCATEGF